MCRLFTTTLFACALALLLVACAAGPTVRNQPDSPDKLGQPLGGTSQTGLPTLPAPASFVGSASRPAPSRQTSKAVVYLGKGQLSPNLPQQNLVDYPDTSVHFEPQTNMATGLAGMAYAGFELSPPDPMDASPVLQPYFVKEGIPGTLYIGLGNYATNRWDWFVPTDPTLLQFSSWEPYYQSGSPLLVVFACRGIGSWILGSAWAGNPLPGFSLSCSATSWQIPADVEVSIENLTDSFDVKGIEWDMDNNGVFETISTPDARQHIEQYSSMGLKTATVRLRDTIGEYSSQQISFYCTDHGQRSWGLSGDERVSALARDEQGSLYLAGSSDDDSALLIKYDSAMNFVWAREWDSAGSERFDAVAAYNGNVYVAGSTLPVLGFGRQTILQKWDSSGNLLLQKSFGANNHDTLPAQLSASTSGLLLCGRGYCSSELENRALLQSFSFGLDRTWGKAYLDGSVSLTLDEAVGLTSTSSGDIFLLLGREGGSGGFALLQLDSAGSILNENYYDGDASLKPVCVLLEGASPSVLASTGTQTLMARFDTSCSLVDDLAVSNNGTPGRGALIDAGGRWVFCNDDGIDASYWQIDFAAASGRTWTWDFSGFTNASGASQLVAGGTGYYYFAGYADWVTGASFSSAALAPGDFSEPSASLVDPNCDSVSYAESLSNTSTSAGTPSGTQDTGGDIGSAADMALFRFGSTE